MTKKVVSVQDISCYGQCSLTVALPILSAMGIETVILPSSVLSTHTGCFDGFTVHDLTDEMPKIVNHWQKERISFDGIYTGYIGDSRQFETILSLRNQLNDGGLFIVDPAMGDHGRLYPALTEDIVEGMKTIVSKADVVLPNITEASFLTGYEYSENYSKEQIEELLQKLSGMGPRYSVITGVTFEEGKIGASCYDKETGEYTYYFSDFVDKVHHGTGDIFASVFVGGMVNGMSVYDSLRTASDFVVASIKATIGDDSHYYGVHFESVIPTLFDN